MIVVNIVNKNVVCIYFLGKENTFVSLELFVPNNCSALYLLAKNFYPAAQSFQTIYFLGYRPQHGRSHGDKKSANCLVATDHKAEKSCKHCMRTISKMYGHFALKANTNFIFLDCFVIFNFFRTLWCYMPLMPQD